jgi:hypothetical protein
VSWIQGLGLLLGPTPEHLIREYWLLAGDLILEIPSGNLKVFTIDSIHRNAPSLNSKVLKRVHESVEVLQLRHDHSRHSFDEEKFLEKLASTGDPEADDWAIFPHLHKFVYAGNPSKLVCVRNSFRNLQSAAINWPSSDMPFQQYLSLLSTAKNLTDVFIMTSEPNLLFYSNFEALLKALTSLKHLTVTISLIPDRQDPGTFVHNFVHTALEDIVILLEHPSSYKAIHCLEPLFTRFQSKEFPNLTRIVIRGPYVHGCLDSELIFPPPYHKKWMRAIKICHRRRIRLVTPEDDLIHLWEERHGIKKEGNPDDSDQERESSNPPSISEEDVDTGSDEEKEEDSINTSDDSQWYRHEDSGFDPETTDSSIWDDSDDEPYRYIARPDIELVDSESESTEDEL